MEDTACKTVLETVEAGKAGFRQGLGVPPGVRLTLSLHVPFCPPLFCSAKKAEGAGMVCVCARVVVLMVSYLIDGAHRCIAPQVPALRQWHQGYGEWGWVEGSSWLRPWLCTGMLNVA